MGGNASIYLAKTATTTTNYWDKKYSINISDDCFGEAARYVR